MVNTNNNNVNTAYPGIGIISSYYTVVIILKDIVR